MILHAALETEHDIEIAQADVCVDEYDARTARCERSAEICGRRRLADAAFTRRYDDGETQLFRRLFASDDFTPKTFGPARWIEEGAAYTTLEPSASGAKEIVRYDTASGARTILVSAAQLTPPGSQSPLEIDDYCLE